MVTEIPTEIVLLILRYLPFGKRRLTKFFAEEFTQNKYIHPINHRGTHWIHAYRKYADGTVSYSVYEHKRTFRHIRTCVERYTHGKLDELRKQSPVSPAESDTILTATNWKGWVCDRYPIESGALYVVLIRQDNVEKILLMKFDKAIRCFPHRHRFMIWNYIKKRHVRLAWYALHRCCYSYAKCFDHQKNLNDKN